MRASRREPIPVAYTDGTGTFSFEDSEASPLTRPDDMEDVTEGIVFTYGSYAE